jgi:hypothetical protein
MSVEIINTPYNLDIYGFSGIAAYKDYVGTVFALSGKMWQIVKSAGLKNKGINIWVYEPGDRVFAGVELEEPPPDDTGLEHKILTLTKYAYYKHVGPYNLIKEVGNAMQSEIKRKGFENASPYIEIYGHWTNDESKLETELLQCLK